MNYQLQLLLKLLKHFEFFLIRYIFLIASEQVTECGTSIEGAHVLQTTEIDGDKCLTDVAITTDATENTKTLCVSAG